MPNPFSPAFYQANRRTLAEKVGTGLIVIAAQAVMQKVADEGFSFRQDSNFLYLTGWHEPEAVLVIDASSGREFIILGETSEYIKQWHGPVDVDALSEISGITEVFENKAGWAEFKTLAQKHSAVYTMLPPPPYIKTYGFYTNPARRKLHTKLKAIKGIVLHDVRPYIKDVRIVKQPAELAAINEAIAITQNAYWLLEKNYANITHEFEAKGAMVGAFMMAGSKEAFHTITAAGKNAAYLHYQSDRSAIADDAMLLIDAGAEAHGYAADLTRLYAPRGNMSPRQQQLLAFVKDVKAYAETQMKPGVVLRDYEKAVRAYYGEKLCELGLIKKVTPEAVNRYYPQATSHHLGVDVHDISDYSEPLGANMVLTIEPGIYIPEEGLGLRIEDDYVVTDTGIENLSAGLAPLLRYNT